MRFFGILIGCFLVSAIFSASPVEARVEKIISPSGAEIGYVKCNRKSGKCLNSAAKHCKGSYQVIDSESHAGGLVADLIPGPVRWYSMTFICGKSDGAFPKFPFRGPEFQMPSVIIPPSVQTTCTTIGQTIQCRSY